MLTCPVLPQKIENKRTRELSEEELTVLRDEVTKYQVEGDLVRRSACRVSFSLHTTHRWLTHAASLRTEAALQPAGN